MHSGLQGPPRKLVRSTGRASCDRPWSSHSRSTAVLLVDPRPRMPIRPGACRQRRHCDGPRHCRLCASRNTWPCGDAHLAVFGLAHYSSSHCTSPCITGDVEGSKRMRPGLWCVLRREEADLGRRLGCVGINSGSTIQRCGGVIHNKLQNICLRNSTCLSPPLNGASINCGQQNFADPAPLDSNSSEHPSQYLL